MNPDTTPDAPKAELLPGSVIDYMRDRLARLNEYCADQLRNTGPGESPWLPEVSEEIVALTRAIEMADNGTLAFTEAATSQPPTESASEGQAVDSQPQQGPMEPWIDTPLLKAKRKAFDYPNQANLDALIATAIASVAAPAGPTPPESGSELLPCPFCGETEKLHVRGEGSPHERVHCDQCFADARRKLWNSRCHVPVINAEGTTGTGSETPELPKELTELLANTPPITPEQMERLRLAGIGCDASDEEEPTWAKIGELQEKLTASQREQLHLKMNEKLNVNTPRQREQDLSAQYPSLDEVWQKSMMDVIEASKVFPGVSAYFQAIERELAITRDELSAAQGRDESRKAQLAALSAQLEEGRKA